MKDINNFLEAADAKAKGVKSDTDKAGEQKAHHAKQMEEMNDKLYFAIMDQYKQMRRHDRKGASKLLEKAQAMKNVSLNAKIGAAYL